MVSSHILSEIESMADAAGIIRHGKMQKEIRVENICDYAPAHIERSVAEPEKAAQLLKARLGLTDFISKTFVLAMLWTAGYWLCFGITYGYNAYFWDNSIVNHLMFSVICCIL